jgi:FkbM family methyltransferase
MKIKHIFVFIFGRFNRLILSKCLKSISLFTYFLKIYGYGISIKQESSEQFIIKDEYGKSINVGSLSRAPYYLKGIENRYNNLAREYMIDNIKFKEGDIFFDVGANVGEIGLFLNDTFNVEYHAFEPSYREYKCCKLNNRYEGAFINNLGLWSEPGVLSFFNKNDSGDSSFIEMKGYESESEVKVDTIDNYVESNNIKKITLLKLEAEGGEPEVLLGAKKSLSIIKYIAADLGYERGIEKEQTFTKVTNLLALHNFEIIDVNTNILKAVYRNKSFKINEFLE